MNWLKRLFGTKTDPAQMILKELENIRREIREEFRNALKMRAELQANGKCDLRFCNRQDETELERRAWQSYEIAATTPSESFQVAAEWIAERDRRRSGGEPPLDFVTHEDLWRDLRNI